MNTTISVDWDVNYIQQVRLIHALAESDFPLHLSPSEEEKLKILKEKFGLRVVQDQGGEDISRHLNIIHSQPLTTVGRISRALIFPHVITDYCRSLWPDHRDDRYSFQGLFTAQRRILIQGWIDKNIRGQKKLWDPTTLLYRIRKKWRKTFGSANTQKWRAGDLFIYSSDRGRKFPVKAWDEEYFRILAGSQFVLCPAGDYVWSYRFFEAILCGAIPIAEKHCDAYEGFRFHSFDDDAASLKWSKEQAEFNYRLCVERLTLPKSILNTELLRLITAQTPALPV